MYDILLKLPQAVNELGAALKDNKEYGFIALVSVYHVIMVILYRRDLRQQAAKYDSRLIADAERYDSRLAELKLLEDKKDQRIGELLEHRHTEFTEIMERSLAVIINADNTMDEATTRVSALEVRASGIENTLSQSVAELSGLKTRVNSMDTRCQRRQDALIDRQN